MRVLLSAAFLSVGLFGVAAHVPVRAACVSGQVCQLPPPPPDALCGPVPAGSPPPTCAR
jgi:hypothetical protein